MILLLPFNLAARDSIELICDIWPPYQIDGAQIGGFSKDVVEVVFKRMGVEVRSIEAYPWKRAITMLEKGHSDALFSANFTESREDFAYYPAETIVDSPWVIWFRDEDGLKFENLDDLKDKRIGVVIGYSYTPQFWDFLRRHKNYEEVVSDEVNFKKLNEGRVDCIVAELGNGYYMLNNLDLKKISPVLDKPIKSDGLYVIFSKKRVSRSFVNQFSDELRQFKSEDLYRYLYQNYFQVR